MKKTSVIPSATFEAMPSPNQTAKMGARTTRGIAFAALMYGSRSAAAVGLSPSHRPAATPSSVPMANARTVSTKVTARCGYILPDENQSQTRRSTTSGCPKKKLGRMPVSVSTCQARNATASSRTRQTSSGARRRDRPTALPEPLADGIGLEHLRAQRGPEAAVHFQEARGQADLGHVARPGEVDAELADRPRARRGGERSEERRVGKERRSRWATEQTKKK